jgi:hypothetical protein
MPLPDQEKICEDENSGQHRSRRALPFVDDSEAERDRHYKDDNQLERTQPKDEVALEGEVIRKRKRPGKAQEADAEEEDDQGDNF